MCLPTIFLLPVIAQHNAAEKQLVPIWEECTSWRARGRHLATVKAFWRQSEAQFYLAFRGFLMASFSCLCTSHPFSAQGRIGSCFYPEGGVSVCCCCAWPLRFLLVLCCLWVNLEFPSCQMSCWLHGPVLCSAHLPAAGLKPSLTRCTNAQLSHEHLHYLLHTFRHNIYNCAWPWSIALFQISDHTIYFLGFCNFLFCSQNYSCAQTPGKGVL